MDQDQQPPSVQMPSEDSLAGMMPLPPPAPSPLPHHMMMQQPQTPLHEEHHLSMPPPPSTPSSILYPPTPGPPVSLGYPTTPAPPPLGYPSTPAPSTPLHHIEEMPHLQLDQVRSILQDQETMSNLGIPPMTPASEEMISHGIGAPPTPHHVPLEHGLTLEQLQQQHQLQQQQQLQQHEQFQQQQMQHHLPAMENMGYDQV